MRQPYYVEGLGSYLIEPEDISEIDRDFNALMTLEVADGTTEEYYKLCEQFDEKWEQWRIVPLATD